MQIGHNGFETLRFSQVGAGYTAVQHRKVDMCSYEHPFNSQLRKSWHSHPLPRAEGRVFSILVVAIWLRPGPVTGQAWYQRLVSQCLSNELRRRHILGADNEGGAGFGAAASTFGNCGGTSPRGRLTATMLDGLTDQPVGSP